MVDARVGIEINGTVCNVLASAHRYFGEPRQPEAYSLVEMYPTVSDDDILWWQNNKRVYENILPVEGAIEGLYYLINAFDVIIITERPPEFLNTTCGWLRSYGVGDIPVVCTPNKIAEIVRLDLDVFIESNADYAREMSKSCTTFIVDRPYNRFGSGEAVRINGLLQLRTMEDVWTT